MIDLTEAKVLAEFANDPEYVRNNYPDFMPPIIWQQFVLTDGGAAQVLPEGGPGEKVLFATVLQKNLQQAWHDGFQLEQCVELLQAGTMNGMHASFHERNFSLEFVRRNSTFPYQRAVMLLALQPWRADTCAICKKYFVRDKPGRKFCSETCFKASRTRSKNTWFAEHGKQWREQRKETK